MSLDLIVVGCLLHDMLDVKSVVKEYMGGVAAYTSLAAQKLGLKVGVVSKVGEDFKYFSQLEGLDLSGVSKQEKTTVFFNTYRKGARSQRLAHVGRQIMPDDIPKDYLEAKAIHLGPVFNEISLEAMRFLKENFKGLITLDPQGFLRREENGVILPKEMDLELLKYVDVVKVSHDEFPDPKPLTEKCLVVIVTQGKKGAIVYAQGQEKNIPVFPAKVLDSTGAGDAFMAGFVKKYLDSQDPFESAFYGSAVASFCVEDFGVKGLKGEPEVEERVKVLKESP